MKYPISHTKNAGNFSRAVFCAGLIIAQTIIAQTPAPSLVGDGSEGDPYLIETIENLHWIAADTTIRDKHFRQTAHIDASVTVSWFSGLGWLPIGHHINNPFNGTYDGNGFAITGLTINRPSFDLQGLFGIADNGSVIKNVGLVDVSITGSSMVGALVGNNHGQIVSCYSTGTVSGHIDETGGLVGRNNTGTIEKSYSTATVSGQNRVGGFAGLNNSGIIAGCYSAGPVLGETLTEAFLGENYMGDVNDCYYSQETSGGLNSVFAQALASTQMTDSLSFPGWDFTTVWNIDQGISYPYLLDNAQTPPPAPPQPPIISIGTLEELQNIGNENFPLNGHYQLTGNIDASPTSEWNGGAGFIPIGGTSGPFTGIFDGNGYVISGLHINRNTSNQTGLFKNVHEAYIENLGLRDVNITGADNTGGLAGSVEYAHISNCFVTGVVKGGSSTGGLIGSSYGVLIAQSYTAGSVTGTTGVGGLAGYSSMSSNVQNCYSTADVTGDYNVGGLVGYVYSTYVNSCYSAGRIIPSADQNIGGLLGSSISAEIVNCFWDVTASGIDTSAGGSPKTSLEMFYATTFTEWDFVNVWSINEAVSYPFLTANAQTPAPAPPVPTYHTVAFNSNDGTPVDTQHIQDEHLAQLPPDPEKAGLRFIGWYSDVALESEWDFPFRTVIEDITLYARWDEPLGEGLVSSGAWSAYADSYGSELDTVEGILDNGIARMGYSIIEDPNSELSPWAQMSVRYNETLFLGLTAVEVEYRAVNDFEMLVDQSGLSQTGDNHKLLLTRSNLWKTVILPLDSFGQAAWVTEPVALDPGTIAGFSFIPMASLSEPTVGAVEIRRLAFHIETHAVMFQFNDGRPVHSEQVPSGALIPVPDDPKRAGYEFGGWYSDQGFMNWWNFTLDVVTADTTLYAKWEPEQIVVHFDPQGGSRPDSITVTVDNPYGTLPQTERQGYAFMGWFTDPYGEGELVTSESIVEIADNHTLYALYETVEYTITYVLDGGVNREENPPLYTIESPEIIFSDPYKEGYIFQGWYGDREYEQPVTAIPSGSFSKVTVWAKWAPDQIVVHFDAQGGSRPDSITVTVDNPYGTLPQTERQGYSFMGWFTDPHGEGEQVTSERTVEIADNHTLYALYEAVEYTITYVLDGGVNSEDNPPFYTIESPEILLRAPSKVGFGFDGWYGDGDHEISITAIPAGSFGEVTVHARWLVDQVTVAYDFAGGEVSEVTYKSVAPGYEYGELPATKRMGYEFMGWFTEREGKGEEIISQSIVTVKAEHQLYAFWIPVNYPIVYNLDGGVNSEENPLYYTIETEVVFSEPQKEGYLFDGWYRDLDLIDTIAKIDSATTGRIQVFAKWLPAVLTLAYSAGENGSLTGEPLQSIPNGGDGTAVEAVADEGYAFIGWSDGVDDNPRIDTNATSDIAVQANFMIKKFRVNFTFEGEGATNPDGEVLNVEYGADITLYLTPRVGWYLMGVTLHRAGADGENLIHNWSASENAMKPDSVVVENITSDCRVHTVFLPIIYTLSYNPGENGTLVGDHFQSLQHGSSGTAVTAVPEQGYVFRSWSDGVQTKTRTDRDVTQSIEVTAQMKAEPAPVRDISVNQTAVDRVVITWNAPDKASPGTEYKIYRVVSDELFFTENKRLDMWELRGQLDQRWLTVFSSDDTVFTDTAVEEATGYIYLVTWTDEEGFESRAVLPITSSVTEYEVNNFSATLVIEKETWQMIAPWGESTLEFGDDTTIVVFGWDERRTEDKLHSHYVRHTEMVPGRGYWVYSEADTILSLPSVSIGKLNDSKDTLGVRLTSKNTGWNQIASPFPYTIRPQWMQTKTVWEWLPKTGGYRIAAVLEPWKAYWVHTEEDTTVKYYPLLSGPVLAKRNSRHIGWDLQVVLGGDGVHDPDNYIGVVSGLAKRGALDEPQPPPPFGSPYLYIIGDCEKRGTRRLSHLYKMAGTNETLEWKIGVAPSKQDLSVTIERIESVPEELYLFWVDKNSAVNLRETAEINIKASAEETGGLIVATHDIKDIENYFAKFGLRPGFPNPFISAITIDFVIPYLWTGPNAHHLDVSVYDIQGRLVRNLMNTAAPAGRYSVIWDATSDNRKEVSSGMYIVRVKYADMAKSVRVMRMR